MIRIEFTAQELDYIANLLMTRPWGEVNGLLANIRRQVDAQQPSDKPPVHPYINGNEGGVDPH